MEQVFVVSKKKIAHFAHLKFYAPNLSVGQIRILISQFAFTTNNITYAVAGESFGYWNFFPTELLQFNGAIEVAKVEINSKEFGVIPVWGIGVIVESQCDALKVGQKVYGYYPAASSVILNPANITLLGFDDAASHRQSLPGVYNSYLLMENDPTFLPHLDSYQCLLRPLFLTSFFLNDLLLDNNYFGADNIIISSASSKTSYSLAYLLRDSGKKIIGITSARNESFSKQLSYASVVLYNQISSLEHGPSVFVDVAGSSDLRLDIRKVLGGNLKYISLVGATQITESRDKSIVEPKREKNSSIREEFFFAPAQISKRSKELGPTKLKEKIDAAMINFLSYIAHPSCNWIRIEHYNTLDELYPSMLGNNLDPQKGQIVTLARLVESNL